MDKQDHGCNERVKVGRLARKIDRSRGQFSCCGSDRNNEEGRLCKGNGRTLMDDLVKLWFDSEKGKVEIFASST